MGRVITVVVALALVAAAVAVAFTAPPASGAHLLGAPALITAGAVPLARLAQLHGRTNQP